jgi:hypothetical protein
MISRGEACRHQRCGAPLHRAVSAGGRSAMPRARHIPSAETSRQVQMSTSWRRGAPVWERKTDKYAGMGKPVEARRQLE